MAKNEDSLIPRRALFAQLYHRYGNATRAYGEAYDVQKNEDGIYPGWCATDGNRLLRNEKVRTEIARLKQDAAELSTVSEEEMVDWLCAAIMTPTGEIGPDSPLCEEYEVKPDGSIKVKGVSKIAAAKELIRLTGWEKAQKVEGSADDEIKAMLQAITGAKQR